MIFVNRILLAIYFVFVTFQPCSLLAVEQDQALKKHIFGAQWSLGSADHDKSLINDTGVSHLYGYYNYAIDQKLAIEIGYNEGSDWSIGWGWDSDDTKYKNFVIATKGSIPLSKRNSLFFKLGGQIYDYQITDQSFDSQLNKTGNLLEKKSGFGFYLEAGWQYRWDIGLGLNSGLQFMDMGNLTISTFTTGISYQF